MAARSAAGQYEQAFRENDIDAEVLLTGERWPEAELYRLRGEFLAALPDHGSVDEASTALQRAVQIARRQSAKAWELRAAISLARLWRDQGRHADARELLAPVYAWFTEGLKTSQVQEAKALLDTLGE